MSRTHFVSMKCEICGREGQPQSFKVCPECNRVVGLECWQPKFKKIPKDDLKYSNCKHRLYGPVKTRGIKLNP